MDEGVAIQVRDVSKVFKLPHEKRTSIKSVFVNIFRRQTYEKQKVLDNVSFDIKRGEFFGIVGRNGSGKSTLLKILASIYNPTSGSVRVDGSLTPFIELGVGFNPELTGRENVFLNGAMLGFTHRQMELMYDEIVEFAELERFMDQKLKNYSSGMQVRLAFSVAIRSESDILLIDEVLAVGDTAFQQKCFDHFSILKKNKKTVILVSHDPAVLRRYCTKGVLIENGKISYKGAINEVLEIYNETVNANIKNHINTITPKKATGRWGDQKAIIKSTTVNDADNGKQKNFFSEKDNKIQIEVIVTGKTVIEKPIVGIVIKSIDGVVVFASNTDWGKKEVELIEKSQDIKFVWQIPNVFNTGEYTITPAIAESSGLIINDWVEEMTSFTVRKPQDTGSIINTQVSIKILS